MRTPGWRICLVAAVSLIVGVVIGIAVVGRFDDPDWFAASGVWIGAAATVIAIVWAVSSFTYEQAQTRVEIEQRVEREGQDRFESARSIRVKVLGGIAQGGAGEEEFRTVVFEVTNLSSTLNVTDVRVLVPTLPRASDGVDLIKPSGTWRKEVDVDLMPVTDAWRVDGSLGLSVRMAYTIHGHRWERKDNDPPLMLGRA